MADIPKKVDLVEASRRYEEEAEEFLQFLQHDASQFAEHEIIVERRDNIVGLRRGRFVLLQLAFGYGRQKLYRVADGFLELDGDPAAVITFEAKGAALHEFNKAIPQVVADLHNRQNELSALGAI